MIRESWQRCAHTGRRSGEGEQERDSRSSDEEEERGGRTVAARASWRETGREIERRGEGAEGKRARANRREGIDYIEGRRVAFLLVDFCGNRATALCTLTYGTDALAAVET